MRFVGRGIAGIGDHHEAVAAEPRDDEVVDDAGRSLSRKCIWTARVSSAAALERAGAVDSSAAAPGPETSNSFMCEMSNRPACSRVCRCSFITPGG